MVGAELEPGSLSAGAASFIVVDFFDFESQATPLLPGLSPAYDFATTFKVRKSDRQGQGGTEKGGVGERVKCDCPQRHTGAEI